MTFIITEPCVATKDTACVEVCPVDCIYETEPEESMLNLPMFINADECIDCAACESEYPVDAIYAEDMVPSKWTSFTDINYKLTEAMEV